MNKKISVIAMLIFLLLTTSVNAATQQSWDKLNELADETLDLAQQEKYDEARDLMKQFSHEVSSVNIHDLDLSTKEYQVLVVTAQNVERALDDENSDPVNTALQFRLLVDALSSEYQPLWTEMEKEVITTFQDMKMSISKGEDGQYQEELQSLLQAYELISPSVQVDVDDKDIERVEQHIEDLKQDDAMVMSSQELVAAEEDFQSLFELLKEDKVDPSLIWVMITTGSIIVFTLSYVGFRKYRAERVRKAEPKRND
ncbi:sporulation protein YpjB [Priestia flexa]|uniref:sporulation protein YpjB n=1 Tax=Priestia flexa TaxID=86664 RepID=UPI002490BDD1|nr:sporulation protein YpjB [Priestia flexa]